MQTARRILAAAELRPAEAMGDLIGLSALCLLIFGGFAATAYL